LACLLPTAFIDIFASASDDFACGAPWRRADVGESRNLGIGKSINYPARGKGITVDTNVAENSAE